jgi:hypothetical protein
MFYIKTHSYVLALNHILYWRQEKFIGQPSMLIFKMTDGTEIHTTCPGDTGCKQMESIISGKECYSDFHRIFTLNY